MKTTQTEHSTHKQGTDGRGGSKLTELIGKLTAANTALYYKTKAAHWTVQGPNFYGLHILLDGMAKQFIEAVDALAERSMQLSTPPPLGLAEVKDLSGISDRKRGTPADRAALTELLADCDRTVEVYKEAASIAEESKDVGSNDLLSSLAREHDQAVWFLRQTLLGGPKADLV